jgi:hypothetical protein
MANSVVTPTITAHYSVGKWDLVIGTLAIAAGDYPSGGLIVSFARNPEIKSNMVPVTGYVGGKAGYEYRYIAGATKDVGKLMIFQCAGSGAPMAEVTTTTPTAATTDTIYFFALFPLLR